MDKVIAVRDFNERLCLAKTSYDHIDASAVTLGNEVAAYQLWPALIFNSYKELHDELKETVYNDKRTIVKITFDFTKLCRTNPGKLEASAPYADSRIYGWAQGHCSHNPNDSFDKKLFRASLDLGDLEYLRDKEKIGFRSEFDTWFNSKDMPNFYESAAKKVAEANLPWKTNILNLNLNPVEKYRILMLGLWL